MIFFQGVFIKTHAQYLKKLVGIGICAPANEKFFPYFACYDFEAYFSQENLPGNGPKLGFEACHVPLSVGIATNVPNFENRMCFVTNGGENDLVQKTLKYVEHASNANYEIMKIKFGYVLQVLEISENIRKENLTKKFEAYCRELIVIAFGISENIIKENLTKKFEAYCRELIVIVLEISENIRRENLTKEFEAYCQELIVIGYNSASYDLNLTT